MTAPRGTRLFALALAAALLAGLPSTARAHGGKYRPPPEEEPPPPPPDPPPPPPEKEKPPEKRRDPEPTPEPNPPPTPTPPSNPPPGTPTPPPNTPPGRNPTPDPRTRNPNRTRTGPGPEDWTAWWLYSRDRWLDHAGPRVASGGDGLGSPGGPADTATAPDAPREEAWKARARAALRRAFPDDDPEVFTGVAVALGKAGDGADAPALLRALDARYPDATLRESLVLGAGLLGPSARGGRDALVAILRDRKDSSRLRGMAALALGLSRDPAAAPALLAAAAERGPSKDPAAPALLALGLLGEPLVVPDLAEFLADESTSDAKALRPFAAFALGRLGGPEAVRALGRALGDSDAEVRRAAILALGECAREDTAALVPALARGMREDRDRACRNFAMVVLGRMGGAAAQDALSRCYALGDRGERKFAALGLGILGRELADAEARARIASALRSDFVHREDSDFRGALAIALGLLRDAKAVPALRAVLKDRGDPELRAHCALALGLAGRVDAVPELRAALVEKGSPALQREAALALGILGDAGAAKVLADLLAASGPEHVRASAARALGELGGEPAADALLALLGDRSAGGAARGQAAVGLGILLDPRRPGALSSLSAGLDFLATTPAIREALTIP